MTNWKPIQTEKQRPNDGQRVFYFFAPSGRWFVGQYCDEHQTGGFFMGRFGSCDWHEAPYWHPEPPAPSDVTETAWMSAEMDGDEHRTS